jgi:hypothetical protein
MRVGVGRADFPALNGRNDVDRRPAVYQTEAITGKYVAIAFRVQVGDRSYYANCIWDALGIPAMLAGAGRSADARIETQCTDCSAPLGLAVDAGRLTTDVAGTVAHFAVPAARWWADIVFT